MSPANPLRHSASRTHAAGIRVDRQPARKTRRNPNHDLVDLARHWNHVMRGRLRSQPPGIRKDRPATCKRNEQNGRIVVLRRMNFFAPIPHGAFPAAAPLQSIRCLYAFLNFPAFPQLSFASFNCSFNSHATAVSKNLKEKLYDGLTFSLLQEHNGYCDCCLASG